VKDRVEKGTQVDEERRGAVRPEEQDEQARLAAPVEYFPEGQAMHVLLTP
jgi:hypothetical protein